MVGSHSGMATKGKVAEVPSSRPSLDSWVCRLQSPAPPSFRCWDPLYFPSLRKAHQDSARTSSSIVSKQKLRRCSAGNNAKAQLIASSVSPNAFCLAGTNPPAPCWPLHQRPPKATEPPCHLFPVPVCPSQGFFCIHSTPAQTSGVSLPDFQPSRRLSVRR